MSKRLVPYQCRHYDGVFPLTKDRACEAGVKYMKLNPKPLQEGWLGSLPCLARNDTEIVCQKREFPAEEECKQGDIDWDKMAASAIAAVVIIKEKHQDETGTQGSIQCPACGEPFHYSIAPNGHVAGSCKTRNCLSFMQ